MSSLDSLSKDAEKIERFYERQVIYAGEAATKLLDDVEYHIDVHGHIGQIKWLLERIPDLPTAIQGEIKKFTLTNDETLFVRMRHCSAPFPLPEDRKPVPTPIRAAVDYDAKPPKITIHLDDNSTYNLAADDSRATLVFALREHFSGTPKNAG